jgi:TonB family protein
MKSAIRFPIVLTFLLFLSCSKSPENSITGSGTDPDMFPTVQLDPSVTTPVDRLPQFVAWTQPDYPRLAKHAGLTGTVWVSVLVDTYGAPHNIQIHQTSGVQLLDDAVIATVVKSRFAPARHNGRAISVRIIFSYTFVLSSVNSSSRHFIACG